MLVIVTILWDLLHCAEGQLLSYDGEKIRWVFKFLCEGSETLHTKDLGLLAAEMLFLSVPKSTLRLVTCATKIVQRKQK